MKAKVFTKEGNEKGSIDLPESVFSVEVNEALLHQVITMYLANQRQGTSKTKTRAEVSGGGKKPWRQKGTGRARSGSNTSPVWVRGGKAFGPKPRDYYSAIPVKMRKGALCCAYSQRAGEDKIMVIDSLKIEQPKTKSVVSLINGLSVLGKKNLLITDSYDRNIYLSGRNIKDCEIKALESITAYDIINHDNIIFCSEQLIEKVKEVAVL